MVVTRSDSGGRAGEPGGGLALPGVGEQLGELRGVGASRSTWTAARRLPHQRSAEVSGWAWTAVRIPGSSSITFMWARSRKDVKDLAVDAEGGAPVVVGLRRLREGERQRRGLGRCDRAHRAASSEPG